MLASAVLLVTGQAWADEHLMIEPLWKRVGDLNGEKGAVESAEFSHDGKLIASGSKYDNHVIVWRVRDGKILWSHQADQEVEAVSFSPDGKLLATGGEDDVVRIWRVSDGELLMTLPHTKAIDGLRFSHNGKILATGEEEGMVRLWNMPEGTLLNSALNEEGTVNSIDFTSDDQFFATAGGNNEARIWRVSDMSVVKRLRRPNSIRKDLVSVRFSPDDRLLASAGYNGYIMIWNVADGSLLKTLNYTGGKVEAVEFTPDGKYLLTGGIDTNIRVIRMSDYTLAHTSIHSGPTEYLHFNRKGSLLVSAHEDGTVRLWLWVSEDPSINWNEHVNLRKRQAAAAEQRKAEEK